MLIKVNILEISEIVLLFQTPRHEPYIFINLKAMLKVSPFF